MEGVGDETEGSSEDGFAANTVLSTADHRVGGSSNPLHCRKCWRCRSRAKYLAPGLRSRTAWTVTAALCGVMACGIPLSGNVSLSSFSAYIAVGLILPWPVRMLGVHGGHEL